MMGKFTFRRSIKGEKEAKAHHLSIAPKDRWAIEAPKKVLMAKEDHVHSADDLRNLSISDPSAFSRLDPNARYHNFTKGAFFNVFDRENDLYYYAATDKEGIPGLVPVGKCEAVGKQVLRDSAGSMKSTPSQPSAGHDSGYAEGKMSANTSAQALVQDHPRPMRLSKTLAKGTGATIFGIVMHDFKAERSDELDARAGETILIIAQSNAEWFVAKPIGRLGGPGLIPVSFIEIRDIDNHIVQDPLEAVRRAGIPKVEEWKKMAADYKNSSIPLGKLESNSAQTLQQGMERMSLSSKSQSNGQHVRAPSSYSQQTQRANTRESMIPVSASVPEYGFSNGEETFYFVVKCRMMNGQYLRLERTYQNFYDLQINLIQQFPQEAGNVNGVERSLPYMPGPVTYVTDNITYGRRPNLDEYIKNLLKLGDHITHGHLVCDFFAPRGTDRVESELYSNGDGYRNSATSQQSDRSPTDSRQSSTGNIYNGQPQYATNVEYAYQSKHQRAQSSLSSQNHHYRNQSDLQVPPPMLRNNSALTQTSASSAGNSVATKIKARFIENDIEETFVIKVQQPYNLAMLIRDLRKRRSNIYREMNAEVDEIEDSEFILDYEDESSGQMYPIETDHQLSIALDTVAKLKLRVTTTRSDYQQY